MKVLLVLCAVTIILISDLPASRSRHLSRRDAEEPTTTFSPSKQVIVFPHNYPSCETGYEYAPQLGTCIKICRRGFQYVPQLKSCKKVFAARRRATIRRNN